jgi:hypothetical protein
VRSSWSAPQPGMYPSAMPGQPLPYHPGNSGGGTSPGGHYMLGQEMPPPSRQQQLQSRHRQSSSLHIGGGDVGHRPYSAAPTAALYDGGYGKLQAQSQRGLELNDDPLMAVEIHGPGSAWRMLDAFGFC